MLPPTCDSKIVSAMGEARRLCSLDLISPNRSTNGEKAFSAGGSITSSRWMSLSVLTVLLGFGDVSKRVQRPAPERVELIAERDEAGLVQSVHASRPQRLLLDEPGVSQHLEVLGDGWAPHGELVGQFDDGVWTLGEQQDDGSSGS